MKRRTAARSRAQGENPNDRQLTFVRVPTAINHKFLGNSYDEAELTNRNEKTMIALKLGMEGRGLSGFPNKQKE